MNFCDDIPCAYLDEKRVEPEVGDMISPCQNVPSYVVNLKF